MNSDKLYQSMLQKMNEMSVVPPQQVGPFTYLYKKIVPQFKYYPWKTTLLLSFSASILLYLFLGKALVKIASILQIGFW